MVTCDFETSGCSWLLPDHWSTSSFYRVSGYVSSTANFPGGLSIGYGIDEIVLHSDIFVAPRSGRVLFAYKLRAHSGASAPASLQLRCFVALPGRSSSPRLWFVEARGDEVWWSLWQAARVDLPAHCSVVTFIQRSALEASLDNIMALSLGGGVPFAYLSLGSKHSCALQVSLGQVRCWGSRSQHGISISWRGDAAGNYGDDVSERIVTADPSVQNNNAYLSAVDLGTSGAVQISAGSSHTCAVLEDATMKCWGTADSGQLGSAATDLSDGAALPSVFVGANYSVHQVSTGAQHTCALRDDGSVVCWGKYSYYAPDDWCFPTCSSSDSMLQELLLSDPPGENYLLVVMADGRKATALASGDDHTCAVLDDESLQCWGAGDFGQLGDGQTGTTSPRLWRGGFGLTPYLGTGYSPGELSPGDSAVDLGAAKVQAVSAGRRHTCALLDDASVKCWGSSLLGQVGQGTVFPVNAPALVDLGLGHTVKQLSAGADHTCAVLDTGSIKCWGSGRFGKLGYGGTDDVGNDPNEMGDNLAEVPLLSRAVQVSCGEEHSCALLDDDSVKCWGLNDKGQLGQGHDSSLGDDPNELGESLSSIEPFAALVKVPVDLRLNGTLQGRVEVLHGESWGNVCSNGWNLPDAQVVCRQLGFAGGIPILHMDGNGRSIFMDGVSCIGTEENLGMCSFRGWGVNSCSEQEAAGVECQSDAWSQLHTQQAPSGRSDHSAVWDGNGSMLIFGGYAGPLVGFDASLHIFKEQSHAWVSGSTVGGPSGRAGHSAVWDASTEAMLLFGGQFSGAYFDQLFLYSLRSDSWSQALLSSKPQARAYHSAVWSVRAARMFVFAGEDGQEMSDLWQYDTANAWRELSQSDVRPAKRSRHTAVWVEAADALLVFGGQVNGEHVDELWHYSFWTGVWSLLPSLPSPSRRVGHSAVFDAESFAMLVFAGFQSAGELGKRSYAADLWNYSLLTKSWTQLAPAGPYASPSAGEQHSAVWDMSSRYMFVLGGFNTTYKQDLWRYYGPQVQAAPQLLCFLGQPCVLELTAAEAPGLFS